MLLCTSHSAVSCSLQPHRLQPAWRLYLWNSPGKNTEVGCLPLCYSWGSSPPRDWTWVSCIAGKFLTVWVTREAQCSCLHVASLSLSVEKWNKILWRPDAKRRLIGKNWCWERLMAEEKGMTEDEMVGWHPWFNGRESDQAPWVGDGQRSLACCRPWGRKQSDMTNWTELIIVMLPRWC